METRVEWIIRSLCLVERLRIPDQGSDGRAAWKEFKGEFESAVLSVVNSSRGPDTDTASNHSDSY